MQRCRSWHHVPVGVQRDKWEESVRHGFGKLPECLSQVRRQTKTIHPASPSHPWDGPPQLWMARWAFFHFLKLNAIPWVGSKEDPMKKDGDGREAKGNQQCMHDVIKRSRHIRSRMRTIWSSS